LKLKFKSLKKELAVMKKDKENLEKKQKGIENNIADIKENHDEIMGEMKVFTQQKNNQLLNDAHKVSDQLEKKNKELELIITVRGIYLLN
jgi:predicted phage-related endonuclease